MRLDLATDLRSRIGAPDKDARLTNSLSEVKAGVSRVIKRPGVVSTGYNYTTPVQGMGGSLPYLIYDDIFSAFDEVPAGAVAIGDLVGGYYAMVDDPPTSPGPGDAYWSSTPPDSRRYQAYHSYELLYRSYNSTDYWADSGSVSASATISQMTTTKLAASKGASALQAIANFPNSCPGLVFAGQHEFSPGVIDYYRRTDYYPYSYYISGSYVDEGSVVIVTAGDSVNTGFHYDGYPDVLCGYAIAYTREVFSDTTGPPPPPDLTCGFGALGVTHIYMVRVV